MRVKNRIAEFMSNSRTTLQLIMEIIYQFYANKWDQLLSLFRTRP